VRKRKEEKKRNSSSNDTELEVEEKEEAAKHTHNNENNNNDSDNGMNSNYRRNSSFGSNNVNTRNTNKIKKKADDMLDELIDAEEGFTEEEMVDFLLALLVAGYETTPTIMTLVVKFITETPAALALLKVFFLIFGFLLVIYTMDWNGTVSSGMVQIPDPIYIYLFNHVDDELLINDIST